MAEHSINLEHYIQLYKKHGLHHQGSHQAWAPPQYWQDSFCLKSWKPLICSLKEHRKPPSQDSRAGFSVGSRRSIHIALTMAPTLLSPSVLSLYTPVPASLHYFYSFNLYHMPITNAHDLSPILLNSWPTTTLLLLGQHKLALSGHVSYWFTWLCGRANRNWQVVLELLLVHSVLWVGQWELACCLALPSCLLYKPNISAS
jgi:hypothetical protein